MATRQSPLKEPMKNKLIKLYYRKILIIVTASGTLSKPYSANERDENEIESWFDSRLQKENFQGVKWQFDQ